MFLCRIARLLGSSFAVASLAACSSGPGPAPTAFVASSLNMGTNGAACAVANTPGFVLGTAANKPVPVSDGEMAMGTSVAQVRCTVSSKSGGFAVSLTGALGGMSTAAGSFVLAGSGVTTSGASGLTGALSFGQTNWSDNPASDGTGGCTLTYTYMGQTVPTSPPVASGRIWGHASCPKMQNMSGQKVLLPSGMMSPEICNAEIDFQFQNCDQ